MTATTESAEAGPAFPRSLAVVDDLAGLGVVGGSHHAETV